MSPGYACWQFLARDLTLHGEMRTRVFAGDTVRAIPGYAAGIDRDDGWVNLSWMPDSKAN